MIDIIIPIYDGYRETVECIRSVLNVETSTEYRLIIVNDKSPNKDIGDFLLEIKNPKIIILNNEENIGFVGSVNKGIQFSNNDVILLNSDTIVTDYWIDKMEKAAYSDERVGTVTALTNRGTIASVPYFNQDNEIPEGYTIASFGKLIEEISLNLYPTIPTAVGHALFIKRRVIEEVGLFDQETFGMGYGEEEDFSCRVIKKGYKNILCDNTFVYHWGSTSFGESKKKYIRENKKRLIKKYWWHPINVKIFLLFNKKVRKVCDNIQKEIKRRDGCRVPN
ncbi:MULTISPECIES: glycosyltransferase family 2 protein [Anoxybacillus]|uniref:Glycosyltransferase n=1 Tax=Anoxybacillus flavithermus TaxID=33934 RepID=A0AAX1ZYW6_9BACL|nr:MULTISPECIES: glycosyltransferase [Anoxybacillus]MBE2919922.1 glycosyltransferase [Anoxybacillus flavithermus]MBE2922299.1 glycosyltransferase [Anoxybacillus flavithermus]MBW7650393.1 glycosyltransferase [Anoxybacillus sp. ST4]RWU09437.1 glycosyltransferase [Anoxybacillus flavithermus]